MELLLLELLSFKYDDEAVVVVVVLFGDISFLCKEEDKFEVSFLLTLFNSSVNCLLIQINEFVETIKKQKQYYIIYILFDNVFFSVKLLLSIFCSFIFLSIRSIYIDV